MSHMQTRTTNNQITHMDSKFKISNPKDKRHNNSFRSIFDEDKERTIINERPRIVRSPRGRVKSNTPFNLRAFAESQLISNEERIKETGFTYNNFNNNVYKLSMNDLLFSLYNAPRFIVAQNIAILQSLGIKVTNFKTDEPYDKDRMLNLNDAYFYLEYGNKLIFIDFREIFVSPDRKCYIEPIKNKGQLNIQMYNYTTDDQVLNKIKSYFCI
jgi:hypothetical protein